jgi:ribosomal protein S18 acetylase RimI-like enzyme
VRPEEREGAAGAVRIRDARPEDRDVLVAFATAMARETEGKELDAATLRAGVAALLADPRKGRTFLLEEDGEVVATLMLTDEWSDWRNGWFWWIQSVYVRPASRGRGHYRRLHEYVRAEAARRPDVYGLRLYVERENRGAQATYRALGMHETHYRLYEQATRPGGGGDGGDREP